LTYITFDKYYNIKMYNNFKKNAKLNKIKFSEYINIRPPFIRFLKIDDDDLPKFLEYDIATSNEKRFLLSVIKPTSPSEFKELTRREGEDSQYKTFISPRALLNIEKEKYILVFKSNDFTEVQIISKNLGEKKIFKLGESEKHRYNIYFTYSKRAIGFINLNNILLEFGKDAKFGLKNSKKMPNSAVLEYYLNYHVLIQDKLENKYLESEYWQNGEITPLKSETFFKGF